MRYHTLCTALVCFATLVGTAAQAKTIQIPADVPYEDEGTVADKILDECSTLGQDFSMLMRKQLVKSGWDVSHTDAPTAEANTDYRLELEITQALSLGNAFSGHRKSVSVHASLFEGDKLIDSIDKTRDSGGGFMGGFKGSCAVLERCVNALSQDLSRWLKKKRL